MSVQYPLPAPRRWGAHNASGKTLAASVTRYLNPKGGLQLGATEGRAAIRAPCDGYLKDFKLRGIAGADNDVYTLRVAAADTSVVLTMTGGGGEQDITDTTSEIEVDKDDLVCWKVVTLAAQGSAHLLEMIFQPR